MKAVNLIPAENRRGTSAVSQSGGGAYLVLAALAALVLMFAVYTLEGSRLDDKQAQAAKATAETAQVRSQVDALGDYTSFASMKDARIQTVSDLAKNRFDWANTLHDLARVVPPNTWLTDLTGTVSPDVAVEGAGGGASVRANVEAPAIVIGGCTTSQPAVAKMMAQMRLIDDVDRVTLTDSEKNDQASSGGGDSAGGDTDCRAGKDSYPKFTIVVFFKPLQTQESQTAAAAGQSAPAGTTTPSGSAQ